jgi:site-specific DNA-cytosine methylase
MGREQSGFSGDGAYGVVDWNKPSGPVVAKGRYDNSRFAVADPRIARKSAGSDFERSGAYGVRDWDSPCVTIKGCADIHNGRFAVADPRLPAATDRLACVIRALDDTWHRPFTTLELAALQGLLDPEEQLELDGLSDSAWRERIGNAVPPPAAAAIAGVMGEVLLLTWSGETFSMSASPIWVRPVAAALMAAQGGAV